MCLIVDNDITRQKLGGVNANHVFRFYKSFVIRQDTYHWQKDSNNKYYDIEKLVTPFRYKEIKTLVVKADNPIRRGTKLKKIHGRALHLYYVKCEGHNITIPVKVLAKHVIKFGTDDEVCVSRYEIPKKYAKRFNLKG